MVTDSGAVIHCECGAAFEDTGICSAYPCEASVPDTHLRNPVWPHGMSLCGRIIGRWGVRLQFVTARTTCRKCGRILGRDRQRNRRR